MPITIFYEDSKLGRTYPLHELIEVMLIDDGVTLPRHELSRRLFGNPRGGVDRILKEIQKVAAISTIEQLFVLVDRDKIIAHINKNYPTTLAPDATDERIIEAMRAACDAPDKLHVFFLAPNMEGLIEALAACAPGRWESRLDGARRKVLVDRDFVLTELKRAAEQAVRACVRGRQPGLDAMVSALREALTPQTPAAI